MTYPAGKSWYTGMQLSLVRFPSAITLGSLPCKATAILIETITFEDGLGDKLDILKGHDFSRATRAAITIGL